MRTQYSSHRLYRQPNITYRGGYSTVGAPAIADPLDLFYGDFSVICSAAGSFTLTANAAATAETRVNFIVIN